MYYIILEKQNKSSFRCDICNKDAHRISFVEHLRIFEHFDNERILPSDFFNEAKESNITKQRRYNAKPSWDKNKKKYLIDKELNKKNNLKKNDYSLLLYSQSLKILCLLSI